MTRFRRPCCGPGAALRGSMRVCRCAPGRIESRPMSAWMRSRPRTHWIEPIPEAAALPSDAATRRFERMGLSVLDGGRHPGVGTANRVIPLGRQYVELLGVVDEQAAQATEYGRSLLARTKDRDRLVRWSLRTDDIESVARRLGLAVQPRSRVRPDGVRLTWRAAGRCWRLRIRGCRSSCSGMRSHTIRGGCRPSMRLARAGSPGWRWPTEMTAGAPGRPERTRRCRAGRGSQGSCAWRSLPRTGSSS